MREIVRTFLFWLMKNERMRKLTEKAMENLNARVKGSIYKRSNSLVSDYEILFDNRNQIKRFLDEIQTDDINNYLEQKFDAFNNVWGNQTKKKNIDLSGTISRYQAHRIYCITRKKNPRIVVETGVCNGYSTTFILLALHRNMKGRLYSIDLPKIAGREYEEDTFSKAQAGSIIPRGKQSGWLVPEKYRKRWELILGRSQEKLPDLVEKLEHIDIFFHDSEHSYECQTFEYNQIWNKLTDGGLIISDDITTSNAFYEFAQIHYKKIHCIDYYMGFLIK